MVYAGINLSTRKRYLIGLKNPQPFAGGFQLNNTVVETT
jgi:hypothetical protein